MNKQELISVLVDEYGYDRDDIKMLTNAKLKKLIKQEEADAEELEREDSMPVATVSKLKDNDVVLVMNGQNTPYTHNSKISNRIWHFLKFGQVEKMSYDEIRSISNLHPAVFRDGHLVVLHKTVQEELGLKEKYKNILTPENVHEIFKKDVDELETIVENLPEAMKVTFVGLAREMMENDTLHDTRVIRFIENKFGLSLSDNAPLSDIVISAKKK